MTLLEVRNMPLGERIYTSLLFAMGLYPHTELTKLVFIDYDIFTEVTAVVFNEANKRFFDYHYRFPKVFINQIPVFIKCVQEEFGDIDIVNIN